MNIVVNIVLIAFIVLGILAGMKKGLIKSAVSLIGLVAVVIISYTLRIKVAAFLIDTMPFFNFGGAFEGLTSLNILIYNVLAFVVIFVLLYCLLNIVITLTGIIDTILKFTVIWIIPSKIGGAIIGLFESWVFLYLVLFVLAQFTFTNGFIKESAVSNFILDNTPIVGNYLGGARKAALDIYGVIEEYNNDETKTKEDLNLEILKIQINYNLITDSKATELMEIGKIGLNNVMISKPQ